MIHTARDTAQFYMVLEWAYKKTLIEIIKCSTCQNILITV